MPGAEIAPVQKTVSIQIAVRGHDLGPRVRHLQRREKVGLPGKGIDLIEEILSWIQQEQVVFDEGEQQGIRSLEAFESGQKGCRAEGEADPVGVDQSLDLDQLGSEEPGPGQGRGLRGEGRDREEQRE